MKSLQDLTLQELWQLFPIKLTPHDERWRMWYEDARAELQKIIPHDDLGSIHHVGSTAIPGIWAKPIVDILIELRKDADMEAIAKIIEKSGWMIMSNTPQHREDDALIPQRISLNKGYTIHGFADRVFHLHLRYEGDNREIAFAEYLIHHPDAAKEYEALKLSLWHDFEHDRDGYTAAKTAFIQRINKLSEPHR